MVHIATRHSVEDALGKLQTILKTKGIPIFALIDHSGEAAKVGMEMHPTKLLIFGNPKGGTPLMLAAPTVAIDLPLKILIWEDDQGKSGSPTTPLSIWPNGTSCPRISPRISPSSLPWPPRLRSDPKMR